MDYFDVLQSRHSIRAYSNQPVEDSILNKILESTRLAPSAGNLQGYEIYIIRKLENRQALVRAAWEQQFLAEAPVVLVFCTNRERSATRYEDRGRNLYCIQDSTIACTYAMLTCSALGLSTVWVGAFHEDQVSAALGIPPEHIPIAILPIGYAAEDPRNRPRRELVDICHNGL